ncbi:TRAP transporter small permease subunit [Marinobacter sp. ANT_B65]|uniref:TRAP transporter small permease subunit n=1 Tax=Marinobacter sp. ANT_B65 TaxID=2039467 RepID=UPI000BBEA01F|nr:TRAP transporter small permease subunit [Marinobacter sp. ANT_B65]PCM45832.1 TRAP transporter permease DctQ [Marinobacter sp. ANT_B65]
MSIINGYCKSITQLNRWLAITASSLVFIMVAVISFEVIARYFFDAPTVWALELSTLLLGPYFLLAGPYFLHTAGHVNVDILYSKLSPRIAAFTDMGIYAVIIAISCVLIYQSIPVAQNAIESGETSFSSWNPPIWPVKALIPVAFSLLLLQAIAEFFTAIHRAGYSTEAQT